MILMIVTPFYSLIYRIGVSSCFIAICVMIVLFNFLSVIMPGISKTEKNAKFVRKDIQHLSMVNCNVKTYAMLDNYSQATFMQSEHLGALCVH